MAQVLNFYYVGIFNNNDELTSVFTGNNYEPDFNSVKLFSEKERNAARQEAGAHQNLNCPLDHEVRVNKITVTAPEIKTAEVIAETAPAKQQSDTLEVS